jgi:hypothetical protein
MSIGPRTRPAKLCRSSCSSTSPRAHNGATSLRALGRDRRVEGTRRHPAGPARRQLREGFRCAHYAPDRERRESRHRPRPDCPVCRLRQRLQGAAPGAKPQADSRQGRRDVLRFGTGQRVPPRPSDPHGARGPRSATCQSRDRRSRHPGRKPERAAHAPQPAGGHHAFEIVDDEDATRDVIDTTIEFVKRATIQNRPEFKALFQTGG